MDGTDGVERQPTSQSTKDPDLVQQQQQQLQPNLERDEDLFHYAPPYTYISSTIGIRVMSVEVVKYAGFIEEAHFKVRLIYDDYPKDFIVTSTKLAQAHARLQVHGFGDMFRDMMNRAPAQDDGLHSHEDRQRNTSVSEGCCAFCFGSCCSCGKPLAAASTSGGGGGATPSSSKEMEKQRIKEKLATMEPGILAGPHGDIPRRPKLIRSSSTRLGRNILANVHLSENDDNDQDLSGRNRSLANVAISQRTNMSKSTGLTPTAGSKRGLLTRQGPLTESSRAIAYPKKLVPMMGGKHTKENQLIRMNQLEAYLKSIMDDAQLRNCSAVLELFSLRHDSFDQTLGISVIEGKVWVKYHFGPESIQANCGCCNIICQPMCFTARRPFWAVLRQSHISLYHKRKDPYPQAVFLLDNGFTLERLQLSPKEIILHSNPKVLHLIFGTQEEQEEWQRLIMTIFFANQSLSPISVSRAIPNKSILDIINQQTSNQPLTKFQKRTIYEKGNSLRNEDTEEADDFKGPIIYLPSKLTSWRAVDNRFESFAPIRIHPKNIKSVKSNENPQIEISKSKSEPILTNITDYSDRTICRVQWHVDGSTTFSAIADAIESATKEIFIQGWWVTPDVHLKRPPRSDNYWRLDKLVQRRAEAGVHVYILMYNEVTFALSLDSKFQEGRFGKHKNIHILRHPLRGITQDSTWFWSHHEKIVVVDQVHGFVGGIDMCWGRYDTCDHVLCDLQPVAQNAETNRDANSSKKAANGKADDNGTSYTFPGMDYYNPRVKDYTSVRDTGKTIIDRNIVPRMPWHDIHCEVFGAPARDLARHFIHQFNVAFDQLKVRGTHPPIPRDFIVDEYYLTPEKNENDASSIEEVGVDGPNSEDVLEKLKKGLPDTKTVMSKAAEVASRRGKRPLLQSMSVPALLESSKRGTDVINDGEGSLSMEKSSSAVENKSKSRKTDKDDEEDSKDGNGRQMEGKKVSQQSTIDTIEENEEEIETRDEKEKEKEKSEGKNDEERDASLSKSSSENEECIANGDSLGYPCKCQVVRSLPNWSGSGSYSHEQSIHTAYIELIERAERFIYIENQFFVSGMQENPQIKNRVVDALAKRIKRAAREKTPFKVIVVLPLLPAFEGQIDDKRSTTLFNVMYWQYKTICRGSSSLYQILLDDPYIVDPKDYICFFGLRTWDIIGRPKSDNLEMVSSKSPYIVTSEIVYVHSKTMIIDDRISVIGSANINDRSMTGKRDSEVCIVIEDIEFENGIGVFSGSFRRRIFGEHLGAKEDAPFVVDPGNPENFEYIKSLAKNNTRIFSKVFGCLPADDVHNFSQLLSHVQKFSSTAGGGGRVEIIVGEQSNQIQEEVRRQQEEKEEKEEEPTKRRNRTGYLARMQSFSSIAQFERTEETASRRVGFTGLGIPEASPNHLDHNDVRRSKRFIDLGVSEKHLDLLNIYGNLVEFPLEFLKDEQALKGASILGDEVYT